MRPTVSTALLAAGYRKQTSRLRSRLILALALTAFCLGGCGLIAYADTLASSASSLAPRESQPGMYRQWLRDDPAKPSEIAALLTTLGGFGITIWSIRKLTEQTTLVADTLRQSAIDCIATQTAEANRLFIDHPELRKYFYDGVEIPHGNAEYDRVQAIAEYLLDYFDSVLCQLHYFPKVWDDQYTDVLTWERYIKDLFISSPLLIAVFAANREWYGERGAKRRNIGDLYNEAIEEIGKASTKLSKPVPDQR